MEEFIDLFCEAAVFSLLNANKGYWLVKTTEVNRVETAYTALYGLYRFVGMPFGPQNAFSRFKRALDVSRSAVNGQFIYTGKSRKY